MCRAESGLVAERVSGEPPLGAQAGDHLLHDRPQAADGLLLVPRVGHPREHRSAEHQRGSAVRGRRARRRQRVRAGQPQHRRREGLVSTGTRDALQVRWCIKLWDITSLGSVQVVGFFDVAARLGAGDRSIAALVGTARSFLCCDKRIQVTFPYVHRKAHCVFIMFSVFVSVIIAWCSTSAETWCQEMENIICGLGCWGGRRAIPRSRGRGQAPKVP